MNAGPGPRIIVMWTIVRHACEGSPLIAPVMEQVHFYAQWSVRVLYGGTYYELTDRRSVFAQVVW